MKVTRDQLRRLINDEKANDKLPHWYKQQGEEKHSQEMKGKVNIAQGAISYELSFKGLTIEAVVSRRGLEVHPISPTSWSMLGKESQKYFGDDGIFVPNYRSEEMPEGELISILGVLFGEASALYESFKKPPTMGD